jgi:hypothetical protein
MKDKTTANLTNFKPTGELGEMFEKAKMHNHFNSLLQGLLPTQFKGITLCLVKEQKVTLLAPNPSIAYRAEKQQPALLAIIQQIEGLTLIKTVSIKLDKNQS